MHLSAFKGCRDKCDISCFTILDHASTYSQLKIKPLFQVNFGKNSTKTIRLFALDFHEVIVDSAFGPAGLKYRSQVTGYRPQVTGYRLRVTGHNQNTYEFAASSYLVRISTVYFFSLYSLFILTNPMMSSYFSKIPSLIFQYPWNPHLSRFFSPTCSSYNTLLMVYWDVTNGLLWPWYPPYPGLVVEHMVAKMAEYEESCCFRFVF